MINIPLKKKICPLNLSYHPVAGRGEATQLNINLYPKLMKPTKSSPLTLPLIPFSNLTRLLTGRRLSTLDDFSRQAKPMNKWLFHHLSEWNSGGATPLRVMIGLALNCNGLGNLQTAWYIQSLIQVHSPFWFYLFETKLNSTNMEQIEI